MEELGHIYGTVERFPKPWELDPAKPLTLTIDGEPRVVPPGTSVYDAILKQGMALPSMCYHASFSPFGSCGICLVEVEGKPNLVRACTAPVTEGMVVTTDNPRCRDGRRNAIEKWLLVHPLDCPDCDADGNCELQELTYALNVFDIKEAKRRRIPEDTRSPVLDFNMERCILCAQCINVCKEVQLVDALGFYKRDGYTHVGAKGDTTLFCEFCGDCLAVCPVGAITNKHAKYRFKPWQLAKTQTTCAYCSDGCQLILESNPVEKRIVRITSPLSWRSKWGQGIDTSLGHGGTCGRGRFGSQYLHSPQRLTQALMREGDSLVEVPWLKAITHVAERIAEVKAQHGPEAIAGLITARCTNEEAYLFQKFMRQVIGTPHLDASARYGAMNAVLALRQVMGRGVATVSVKEITHARVLLLIGTNITETNPLAGLRVKEAIREHKAQVIVVDPMKTSIAKLATHHLAIAPGSEGVFLRGLIKAVIEKGLASPAFTASSPQAYEAFKAAAVAIPMEAVEQRTGIGRAQFEAVAELVATGDRVVTIFAEGILARPDGYRHTLLLLDLALLTGQFEKPGSGLAPLWEENNEQGVVDMGAVAELLPGQAFAPQPGATLVEILEKARRGEIKLLYLIGENPVGTLPAGLRVREALERVECLVAQDLFLTETGRLAHVVLPACAFAEKEGTFTNWEGRVNLVNQAIEPPGECRPDWQLLTEVAELLGHPMAYSTAAEIRDEISRRLPGYFGPEGNPRRPALTIPAYLPDGFAEAVPARYALPGDGRDGRDGVMALVLGQVLFHSGKLSTRADGLTQLHPAGLLTISAADATRLGVAAGGRVRVTTPSGSAIVPVEVGAVQGRTGMADGVCFFPEHFTDPPVKDLLPCTVDPVTHVPAFKAGAVTVEPVPPDPDEPAKPGNMISSGPAATSGGNGA